MNAPSVDVGNYIGGVEPSLILDFANMIYQIDDGEDSAGTFAGTSSWGVYVSKEPTSPDSVITVYDFSGFDPDPDNDMYNPSVQVRIRGNAYLTAYTKAAEIRDALIEPSDILLGGTLYQGIWQQGSIETLGYDDNDRVILVMNFNITRQEV